MANMFIYSNGKPIPQPTVQSKPLDLAGFDETKHPRDSKGSSTGGHFKSKGGESTGDTSSKIKKGSKVKFKQPESDEEKNLVFIVLEDNGDRVLVEAQVDMGIKPTFVYLKKDLIRA